jgi:putative ABC transport system substrate-binding protein
VQAAAAAIGGQVEIFTASSLTEIETAFETLAQKGIEGLVAGPGGPLFSTRRLQIVALATRYAVPTIYPDRQDAEVGGLMSYGSSIVETYRQQGIYTGRVLKGEKPGDLPVMRTTKFEFINLPAARLLGIKVPPTLLALADEIIE